MAVILAHNEYGGSKRNYPKMVVVHCMGEFLMDPYPIHATDFLKKIKLSAHALVAPSGDIYVCRDDDQTAWHARGFNQNSLGIEFLVSGHHTYESFIETIKEPWVSLEQFEAGIQAVRAWVEAYEISREQVVRHSDLSPGRKVDPGRGFLWPEFLERVFE